VNALRSVIIRALALSAACVAGCRGEVPLGSWGTKKDASGSGGTTSATPECLAVGEPGPTSPAGAAVSVTVPYTDWEVATPFDSIEIEMRVEIETAMDGFIWTHEVPFAASGTVALLTLQSLGGYQADPPNGPVELTKMTQFWISGPPLAAELGDIPYPDARASRIAEVRGDWWSINAKYDWQPCRPYRLRLAAQESEQGGSTWYAAWITDVESETQTLVGRMLVPDEWGGLSSPTSTWSNRIGWSMLDTCDEIEPVSTLFGAPVTASGPATLLDHRFGALPACSNTRIETFPSAVRQRIGGGP
jgi:hypothetical protein